MNNKSKMLAEAGIIAALYVILTEISATLGLASGPIQLRLSEALCVLAMFTPAAIPGLTVGCLLGNVLSGCAVLDVIFGSLATLLGAIGSFALKKRKIWAIAAPILSNTVIIPLVLKFEYGLNQGLLVLALGVFAGEFITAGLLGQLVMKTYNKITLK